MIYQETSVFTPLLFDNVKQRELKLHSEWPLKDNYHSKENCNNKYDQFEIVYKKLNHKLNRVAISCNCNHRGGRIAESPANETNSSQTNPCISWSCNELCTSQLCNSVEKFKTASFSRITKVGGITDILEASHIIPSKPSMKVHQETLSLSSFAIFYFTNPANK